MPNFQPFDNFCIQVKDGDFIGVLYHSDDFPVVAKKASRAYNMWYHYEAKSDTVHRPAIGDTVQFNNRITYFEIGMTAKSRPHLTGCS